MRPVVRPTPARVLRPIALAAASLALLGPAGCASEDPIEAIRQLQEIGDFEGSLAPLRKLLAEHPDDPEANYRYGQALSVTQQPNLARWSLRKAMKDPDWLIPAGLLLAYGALAAHDFNEVDEIVARILEREPDNVPALLMRANAHAYWRKDPERALADANRVLELDPDSIEAYEPRILALDALGRYEEAAASLAEAGRELEARDAVPSVLAWHCATTAGFQKMDGKIEEARVTWRACLEAHPANLEVVSGAMSFYDSQGEPRRSLEVARAALAAAPGNRLFRTALAERLRVAGQVAEAEALLRQATESPQPEVASAAWMDLSKLRQAMGEYGASADALERAIALAKGAGLPSLELLFGYADVLVAAGRLERALEVADEISLPAYRHLIRARVLQERRDPAGALEEFDAGIRLWLAFVLSPPLTVPRRRSVTAPSAGSESGSTSSRAGRGAVPGRGRRPASS